MHQIARLSCFAVVMFATAIQAQSVISARSGTVHYVEGKVLLNDQAISPKFGEFPAMDNGAILRTTAEGRVEVLLSPGVILRVGESSSIRMVANSLLNTRVELLAGKAVLECSEILKGNAVVLVVAGKAISFARNGVYEATAEPPAVFVFRGQATVQADGRETTIKRGHQALLGAVITAQRFDEDATDDLYNWSSRRSGYLALANVSAARSMASGYGYGSTGSAWAWNPWFGMFTMVPATGMAWSPFGYGFYSPYSVYGAYEPYYYGYNGGYYGNGSGTTSGSTTYSGRPATQTSSSGYGASSVSMGRSDGGSSPGTSGGGGGGRSVGGTAGSGSTGRGGH